MQGPAAAFTARHLEHLLLVAGANLAGGATGATAAVGLMHTRS